jgi:spore maturation protein CgeB
VWIGNWGDGERARELEEFLIGPVAWLGLSATLYGVRYPDAALRRIRAAGFAYGGWLANAEVPGEFARHRVTVHVPRRPYAERLPGIPTIRVFEALACGIPLVTAPWQDTEGLFRAGEDFLVARSGDEMIGALRRVLADREFATSLRTSGLQRIAARHTCGHRVDELFAILAHLGAPSDQPSEEHAA